MINVLCIGTPHIVGDSIGPLVGTMLKYIFDGDEDVSIIGTLLHPVIARNYRERLREINDKATLVVVDAAVGGEVGTWELQRGPMQPGALNNSNEVLIGDISIKCYTGSNTNEMITAEGSMVYSMALEVTKALYDLLKLQNKGI